MLNTLTSKPSGLDKILCQTYLSEALVYTPETGDFSWVATRPPHHFENSQAFSAWHTKYAGRPAGTIRKSRSGKTYRYIHIDGRVTLAHRLAFVIMTGRAPAMIDHLNGSGADNRWENIREVSGYGENNKNQRLRSDNTSGVTGVIWFKRTQQWKARITVDGKHKSLGYFDDKDEAIKARLRGEIAHGYHENHGAKREL
jgi:hypothetical protein